MSCSDFFTSVAMSLTPFLRGGARGALVADAVLDVELEEDRYFAPAQGISFEGPPTLGRGRETVFPKAQQRATWPILEVELDRGHIGGRVAPLIDEARRWSHLEDDAVHIGVDVLLCSPTAPMEPELSTGS